MQNMKPLYDNILVNCTIVSDTHQDIKHPTPELPQNRFRNVLAACKSSEAPVDALIIDGDVTSRGTKINWGLFRDCFAEPANVYAKHLLLQLGNHDTWSDISYEDARREYFSAMGDLGGRILDHVYYDAKINGYSFLFLGSESDAGCGASISEEQLVWLEETLAAAVPAGKPIFVFNHQALNGTHGLPRTFSSDESDTGAMDGGIGSASDRVKTLLAAAAKQVPVFFFSGHSHMGLSGEEGYRREGYASFEVCEGIELVMLPSLACGNHHGEDLHFDIGYQLEIYADRVIIRPRNFAEQTWNTDVVIRDGKPYLSYMLA
ncbi:MAG: metallophosphoesterase [Clostridia bacterium]|nr:metallophosphoesterase [Clostridia bacterium]